MSRAGFLVAATLLTSCSVRKLTIDTTANLLHEGQQAFASESDVGIARAAAPGQLKTIEGILVSAPKHRTLLEMAARGYMEYAFGFLEEDLELLPASDAEARRQAVARATAMYDRAFVYSVRFLETFDGGIRAAITAGGPTLQAALKRLPPGAVPGLAYGGMALASSVNLDRGDPARIADLPRARLLVERAFELDPRFYDGGPAMTLGVLAAQRGDVARARGYFETAEAASGGLVLLPRVMMARTLLVETEDRKRYKAVLESVLATPRDALPRARLVNEIARRRAQRYLGQMKKVF